MEIVEILLFYSKFSANCKTVITYVKHYNIPVTPVSVDSKEIRKMIRNGNYFNIKGVPTIVIMFKNGNAEIYEGTKVIEWLKQFVLKSHNGLHNATEEEQEEEEDGEVLTAELLEEALQGTDTNYEMIGDTPSEVLSEVNRPKEVKNAKMSQIKNIAIRMEAQRKKTLGYDEDSLPHI